MSQDLKNKKIPDIQRERKNNPSRHRGKSKCKGPIVAKSMAFAGTCRANGRGVGDFCGERCKALITEGFVAMRAGVSLYLAWEAIVGF